MLLKFSCSNHRSIRKEVTLSAEAGKDTVNLDKLAHFNDLRISKTVVIYGANGSGKSNLLDALIFVRSLVINSIKHQPGRGIRQIPHKLESLATDSTYRICFITGGVRYEFGFTLNNLLVKKEYLYAFPNGRQTKIYERLGDKFVSGSKFRGKFSACKNVLKPNRLLLSCAANFSAVNEIDAVFKFFRDELVIYPKHNNINYWLEYSLWQIHDKPESKEKIIKLMNALGVKVKDIEVKIEQRDFDLNKTPLADFLSDEFKKQIIQGKTNVAYARFVYDKFSTDLNSEESSGTKKLFTLLCPLIDIIEKGKVLFCDELESSLHEILVEKIVKMFLSPDNAQAQIFFTTHNTGLLDLDLFRRDQIWFTELKDSDRSTDLYSLADCKNVRKDEKFSKGYISGRYGAIPLLNREFTDIVTGK